MLLVPFVIAAGVAGRFPAAMLLLLVSLTAFYLARFAAVMVAKAVWAGRDDGQKAEGLRWLARYGAAGAIAGLPLIWPLGYWDLLYLAGFGAVFFALSIVLARLRRERTESGEALAVLGLSLSAPAAYYVASGRLDGQAWLLWLLNVLYFGGTILYVKMWINTAHRKKQPADWLDRFYLGRYCVAYHLLLAAFLAAGVMGGHWPLLAALAFAPVLVRTASGLKNLSPQPPIRKIGFQEMWLSLLFAALLICAWHLGGTVG